MSLFEAALAASGFMRRGGLWREWTAHGESQAANQAR